MKHLTLDTGKPLTFDTATRTPDKRVFATRKHAVKRQMLKLKRSTARGALLLELLVAISILAVVLSVGTQSIFVSMQSGKISGERDVATGLASEVLEGVRGGTEEKWQNLYNLTKGSQYYPTIVSDKWVINNAGQETVTVNGVPYTRYFIVEDVNRCTDASRDIASSTVCSPANAYSNDPSTQKVTVSVTWPQGLPVTLSEYFFRWKNKVCQQTSWSGGASTGVKSCPDTTFDTKDAAMNTDVPGEIKIQ